MAVRFQAWRKEIFSTPISPAWIWDTTGKKIRMLLRGRSGYNVELTTRLHLMTNEWNQTSNSPYDFMAWGRRTSHFYSKNYYALITTKKEVYVCSLPCLLLKGLILCSAVVPNLCTSPTPSNAQDTQPYWPLIFLLLQQFQNTHSKFTEWIAQCKWITVLYRLIQRILYIM